MSRSSDSAFPIALLRDKTFQAREIRRVIAFATLYLVLTTIMLGVFYHHMLGQLVSGKAPMLFVSEDMNMLNEQIPSLSSVLGRWIIMMMAMNVVVTSLISIYIIRKLGQPLMAVKRALREIGDGKLNVRMRASDDDEFGEITQALASAVSSINRHVAAAKGEMEQIEALRQQPAANSEELETSLTNCKIALDYFVTDSGNQATSA
ncbi:MAG: methyl-accepting chemotaxis protein [Pseudomonadota bacterium]